MYLCGFGLRCFGENAATCVRAGLQSTHGALGALATGTLKCVSNTFTTQSSLESSQDAINSFLVFFSPNRPQGLEGEGGSATQRLTVRPS